MEEECTQLVSWFNIMEGYHNLGPLLVNKVVLNSVLKLCNFIRILGIPAVIFFQMVICHME